MKLINTVADFTGARVLVRVDFNVPIENGKVIDTFRIDKALSTINYLRDYGARIILISHLGEEGTETLAPVGEYLNTIFPTTFVKDITGPVAQAALSKLVGGEVLLLENLRTNPGEVANDPNFAKELASLGTMYVNEAFSVSHRAHASVVGVPKLLPSYGGLDLGEEVQHLSLALTPTHPFLFILGGAKFSTKLPLVSKFLTLADRVYIGGALANTFYKAKGFEVGTSVVEEGDFGIPSLLENPKLILPESVIALDEKGMTRTTPAGQVLANEKIIDIAPQAIDELENEIMKAKLIVWNGPMGKYEDGYTKGTARLLELLAQSTGTTILGGGDTVALLDSMGIKDKFTFISTGGGATLAYLGEGTLPGIEALG